MRGERECQSTDSFRDGCSVVMGAGGGGETGSRIMHADLVLEYFFTVRLSRGWSDEHTRINQMDGQWDC